MSVGIMASGVHIVSGSGGGIIGYDTIAPNSAATGTNWQHEAFHPSGGRTYVGQSGDGALTAYVYGDGTGTCTVALYTVVAGAISALIEQVTVTIGSSAGWYSQPMSTTLTPGTEYTAATRYNPDGSDWNIRYVELGGTQTSASNIIGGNALPNPWTENNTTGFVSSFYIEVAG